MFSSTGLSSGFASGSAASPSIFFTSDTNTGLYNPSNNRLNIATNGVERLDIGDSSIVVNGPGNDVDFRIEGTSDQHLLNLDAGNNRVGISTSSPSALLDVDGGDALIHGATVGRGAGDVATNTVVGKTH